MEAIGAAARWVAAAAAGVAAVAAVNHIVENQQNRQNETIIEEITDIPRKQAAGSDAIDSQQPLQQWRLCETCVKEQQALRLASNVQAGANFAAEEAVRRFYARVKLPLQETELDWPVAMAAATAADKSAMAAAAAGEEAAQLAVRRYVFEGMAPQHWPQAAAAPSQSGSKPCSKPRSRMPLVRLPSRQAARQVKPMPMRTLSSDAAFESALQLATAQAKVPAIKRPPPPPSSYHAHSAAPDIAPQQAPALQPPKAPQQHPSVRMQKHVPPPATASLQSGPQLPAQGPPSTAGETVSDALPPPPPPPPPPPQRPRQAAMTQQLSLAPQQQPQQVVQDGTLQAIMAMLDSKLPPAAQGSPSAAGWTLTIDGITLYILPTSQPPASAGQLEPQQPPANTTCHFEMQPRLLPRSVPDYSWQEKVFMNMNHWFTIAAKDQATRASQRQKNRCLAGAREYREEAMPKPRWR